MTTLDHRARAAAEGKYAPLSNSAVVYEEAYLAAVEAEAPRLKREGAIEALERSFDAFHVDEPHGRWLRAELARLRAEGE